MTGDTQAVRRIIQVLEWRDSLRENLEATMNLQPRFYLLGLDTLLKRRRLERLRDLAGIECDYERKRIETVEDLDCLSALWELQVSGQRFQEIKEALPFALSQEEVINHILLKAVAKWSLASNAKQHVLVLEACEEEIARRDGRAKLALLEIAVDARLSQRDYGLTAKWIKEFLRLNPSHRGMNDRLFLAESELELDRLMTLSKGSPIMDATLPDPKEAARACAKETEGAGSYYSRGIMRDRTDEALNSADYVTVKWSIAFESPNRFQIFQAAFPDDYDEWISLGPDTFQNVGLWFKSKDYGHDDLNQMLKVEKWLEVLQAAEPMSGGVCSHGSARYLVLEYVTEHVGDLFPTELPLGQGLDVPGEVRVWIDASTNFLAKAELIFNGRSSDGEDIRADYQQVFTAYNGDIRIEAPELGMEGMEN